MLHVSKLEKGWLKTHLVATAAAKPTTAFA